MIRKAITVLPLPMAMLPIKRGIRDMMKKFILILAVLQVWGKCALAGEATILEYKQALTKCYNDFEHSEKYCSDWSAKCFSYILTEQEKLQKCYQSIAVRIFTQYYGLSNNEALLKYNKHKEFLQQEYQFVYGNTIYCKENNCGIAPDLYSEYATSQGLYTYIKKTMSYIENQ